MIKLIVAAAATLALAGSALAQTPINYADLYDLGDLGGHVIANPDRIGAPSGEALSRAYPRAALSKRINGTATLNCRVTAEGRLTDCEIASEAPDGYGFGRAALSVAPLFEMRPGMVDGAPVAGFSVSIPIVFKAYPGQPNPERPAAKQSYAQLGSHVPAPPELAALDLPQGPLGILGVTKQGTIMSFVVLDGQHRHGGEVEFTRLNVMPRAGLRTATFQVARTRVDCGKGTIAMLGIRYFDWDGETEGWSSFDYPNITRPTTSFDQRAFDVACHGPTPSAATNGAAEALAIARGWPGH